MNKELADEITNTINKSIQDQTVAFVEDSTNVISGHNLKHLQEYAIDNYSLIYIYYTINKLIISPDKTKHMYTQ